MNRITLFTKAECSLCGGVLYVIERVQKRIPFEFEQVDIAAEGNEEWLEAYKNDIPVVHLNGKEIARHRVSERVLREQLMDANASSP